MYTWSASVSDSVVVNILLPLYPEKLIMNDVIEYTNEGPITFTCQIHHARNWKSFSIRRAENGTGRSDPLSVIVHSSGAVEWSGQSPRLDVHYMTEPSTDEGGTNLTVILTFFEVYCRDAGEYVCQLNKLDDEPPSVVQATLIVKGKTSSLISYHPGIQTEDHSKILIGPMFSRSVSSDICCISLDISRTNDNVHSG